MKLERQGSIQLLGRGFEQSVLCRSQKVFQF